VRFSVIKEESILYDRYVMTETQEPRNLSARFLTYNQLDDCLWREFGAERFESHHVLLRKKAVAEYLMSPKHKSWLEANAEPKKGGWVGRRWQPARALSIGHFRVTLASLFEERLRGAR
jgi:hypothetical protein